MEVIISCAGATKLINYRPNHFLEVDGEFLLHRTIRQLNAHGITPDVVGNEFDKRYMIPGSRYVTASTNRYYGQARFRSAERLFSSYQRTVALLGDVFFTDEAIYTIINDKTPWWRMYGRMGASSFTGCKYGEIFGMSFYPEDVFFLLEISNGIISDIESGAVTPGASHWDLYTRWAGVELPTVVPQHFVEIDDWTDDFDYPADYEKWTTRRKGSN